jgi:hypothetical protein
MKFEIPSTPMNPYPSRIPEGFAKTPPKRREAQADLRISLLSILDDLEKASFHVMIASPAPTLPPWGEGRIAIIRHYLN